VIAAGGGSFQPKRPADPRHRALRGQVVALCRAQDGRLPRQAAADRRRRRQRARLDAQPAADRQAATLVHRRDEFRGAPDSVNKMRALVAAGGMDLKIGQVTTAGKATTASSPPPISRAATGAISRVEVDDLLPFFGLTMKLGPVADWGLKLEDELIPVNVSTFETSIPGMFAIGDINTYPGKLK